MFSFSFFRLNKKSKDWKIVINDHEIICLKKNAEIISKLIQNQNKKGANKDCFSITIPEFNDSFICSESDFEYFQKIFNCDPIQITNVNKEILKKFADKFEIEALIKVLELFDSYYDTITNYKPLQIQEDISKELINIEEDNFDSTLTRLKEIEEKDEDNIITSDLLYNIFLNLCFIRPMKVEILINFLKKYEEITKKNHFQSFKQKLSEEYENSIKRNNQNITERELDLNHSLKTMQFVLFYLSSINEIDRSQIKLIQNFDYGYNDRSEKEFTNVEIEEYKNTGYCTKKIYHVIKNDDLESFTEMITETQSGTLEFNKKIPILIYERNPDVCYKNSSDTDYLNLAAFYGSEQIFNYILMNLKLSKIEYVTLRMAFMGGNISIISKCIEMIEMDDSTLESCICIAIKYNYAEILEWLFENYEVTKTSIYKELTLNRLIENAIKFNNIEVLTYLLSLGIDHTSIFTYSLFYNQLNLTKLAIKLPYDCDFSFRFLKNVSLKPYSFKYHEVFFNFHLSNL